MIAGDTALILSTAKHSLRNYNFNTHLLNLFIGRTLHDEHMIREQPLGVCFPFYLVDPIDQARVIRLKLVSSAFRCLEPSFQP